jgi:hypothetical protein
MKKCSLKIMIMFYFYTFFFEEVEGEGMTNKKGIPLIDGMPLLLYF